MAPIQEEILYTFHLESQYKIRMSFEGNYRITFSQTLKEMKTSYDTLILKIKVPMFSYQQFI